MSQTVSSRVGRTSASAAGPPTQARRRAVILLALAALALAPAGVSCTSPATAGRKLLTLEEVHGPRQVNFSGSTAEGLEWLPDGQHYLERRDGVLQRIDVETGEATPAYDVAAFETALTQQGDFDAGAAKHAAHYPSIFSEDRRLAILQHQDRLYAYWFDTQTVKRLTESPAERRVVTLSPDNARVAFVDQDNNVHTIDLATAARTVITTDGSDTLLNGYLDWVYQEEVFGRGNWRAYWWSKDGRYLAYLQLDQTNVPIYPLVDHLQTHPQLKSLRYPKPGDPNAKVRLGIVPATGGPTVWADLGKYDGIDIALCNVAWSPAGRVTYYVHDRESLWQELNAADPETGAATVLIREQATGGWTPAYGPPHWLADGSFLWTAARDGWAHLYHCAADGRLIRRVTEGPWEVRRLHGVDEQTGWAYFTGTRDSHLEEHAYRVSLTTGEIQRLTAPGFSHNVQFSADYCRFIDRFSNLTTPSKVYLRHGDGALLRVISENKVAALDEYALSRPEIVEIPTPGGYTLKAELIRPLHMWPWRKYPVCSFVYGGPHIPAVGNRWGGNGYMFKQLLAQKGYIVWTCDPYSASGEGEISAWHCYQRLGVNELADLETGLRWLAAHEPADLGRVSIAGHSYGGFMAAFALTHSKMFKVGIAAAGLTDWHNYDTFYSETLMRTPANNPRGYEESSVLAAAKNLHGRLLVAHGMMDDNVHVHNSLQLIHALQQAGLDFDLMIYPGDAHGFGAAAWHWAKLQLSYIERNL